MWRAFFLAVGFFLILLGLQCLAVEKFILRSHETTVRPFGVYGEINTTVQRQFVPKPWTPYSLIAGGAVVCLYCYSIPKRMNTGK